MQWEENLGRELAIRNTPYKDQMDDMDARLAAIKSVDEETADRFMALVKKEVDEGKALKALVVYSVNRANAPRYVWQSTDYTSQFR